MKFGWMTLSLSPSAADDLACVHQQLEQGVLAEAMGFDYLWLTEHNFTGECAYADPTHSRAPSPRAPRAPGSASPSSRWPCTTPCVWPSSSRCSTT
jgi:alkanesulfonate monooxygenase SsuD/methylene tetrahydromethanopterin reductase-like flavin-dependent oxidoreductase (luciferase family)